MTRSLPLLAALLISACLLTADAWGADNELTPEEAAAGWQLLFNGHDHAGWKTNNGKPIASAIEEGALQPHGSGGYILMHERQFGDFRLACDVKLSAPECNSGIFFRVGNAKNPVYSGFEVQLFTEPTATFHDFGAIYDLVAPSKNNARPVGEWNHVEVICRGPEIRVVVNGEEVSRMNCDEWTERGLRPDGSRHKFGAAIAKLPRAGYLGFQDHGQKCWIKNVKLLELKP